MTADKLALLPARSTILPSPLLFTQLLAHLLVRLLIQFLVTPLRTVKTQFYLFKFLRALLSLHFRWFSVDSHCLFLETLVYLCSRR